MRRATEKVKHTWDGNEYELNSQAQNTVALKVLTRVPFRGDERVLDVGCGDGRNTAHIALTYVPQGSVVGIDLSSNMINHARRRYGTLLNSLFQTSDVCDLSYDNEFDRVVSFSALHWVKRQKVALKKIYKSLKSGGDVLFHLSGGSLYVDDLLNSLATVSARPKYAPFVGFLNHTDWLNAQQQKEYEALLKEVGFVDVSVEQGVYTFFSQTKQDFINSIRVVIPHVNHLSQELCNEFLSEVVDEHSLALPPDDSGTYRRKYVYLFVTAKK